MEYTFPDFPRIVISQEICLGKPRIKNTRIPVSSILAQLASGITVDELLKEFYWLQFEDIQQVLAFSAALANDRIIPLVNAA
jgi:uncharacterized protein (DUF433 family)